MKEQDDEIKNLFSSKLKDFEADVPWSSWPDLDRRLTKLETKPAIGTNRKATKKIVIALSCAAAVALFFMILIPSISNYMPVERAEHMESEELRDSTAHNPFADTTDDQLLHNRKEERFVAQKNDPNSISHKHQVKLNGQVYHEDKKSASASDNHVQNTVADNTHVNVADKVAEDKPADKVEQTPSDHAANQQKGSAKNKEEHAAQGAQNAPIILPKKKLTNRGFSLALAANSGLLSERKEKQGEQLRFSNAAAVDNGKTLKNNFLKSKLEHKQPVSFGLSVNKYLTDRLSVEIGATFTHLSSKIVSEDDYDIERFQILNYVGVPVALNYTFARAGKAQFYTSVGATVQKDVYGRYTGRTFQAKSIKTEYMEDYYSEPYYQKTKIEQENLQLSANASLGASFPLYKNIHAYANVGAAYYFDAHNKYATIYSDKDLQLDLKLGLKINLK